MTSKRTPTCWGADKSPRGSYKVEKHIQAATSLSHILFIAQHLVQDIFQKLRSHQPMAFGSKTFCPAVRNDGTSCSNDDKDNDLLAFRCNGGIQEGCDSSMLKQDDLRTKGAAINPGAWILL